jgi:hypothetical protein
MKNYTIRFIFFLLILILYLYVIPYYLEISLFTVGTAAVSTDTVTAAVPAIETVTAAVPAAERINLKIPHIILDIMNNCINNTDMFVAGAIVP